jgi:hypothetical protein
MENDLDTLDCLSDDKKQAAITIWAMANSPRICAAISPNSTTLPKLP